MYRREILDNATARNAGIEKVLRLFDASDNSEKYCQLRGEWERTEVEHGDIVNIIGEILFMLRSNQNKAKWSKHSPFTSEVARSILS